MYKTKDELKAAIKQFSIKGLQESSFKPQEIDEIDSINILMPMKENLIINSRSLTVKDMPGIEDALCLRKMLEFIEMYRYKILPMFVIDMT
jgi:hypothetical protein